MNRKRRFLKYIIIIGSIDIILIIGCVIYFDFWGLHYPSLIGTISHVGIGLSSMFLMLFILGNILASAIYSVDTIPATYETENGKYQNHNKRRGGISPCRKFIPCWRQRKVIYQYAHTNDNDSTQNISANDQTRSHGIVNF